MPSPHDRVLILWQIIWHLDRPVLIGKSWSAVRLRPVLLTRIFIIFIGNVSGGNHNLRENPYKLRQKNRLNSPKNYTCRWYDDTQFCKISCPNLTSFVRYKNNKFQNLLFYISQTKSSLDKIFYMVVYHHISCMCDFFGKFRRLFLLWFARVFTIGWFP